VVRGGRTVLLEFRETFKFSSLWGELPTKDGADKGGLNAFWDGVGLVCCSGWVRTGEFVGNST
jgi:hypothetical protein